MQTLSVSELQEQLSAKDHHVKLLAQALGNCIEAAGITRAGAALNGPELLMFADDLKRHLEEQASGKGMPEGAERCDECGTITARMDGDGCAKWCCCCGARLTGNYVSMSEPATLENDAAATPCPPQPPVDVLPAPRELITEAARLLHIYAPGGGSAEDFCLADLRALLAAVPGSQQGGDA